MSRKGRRRQEGSTSRKLAPIKSKHKQVAYRDERLFQFFAYLSFSKTVVTIRHIPKSVLIGDFKEHLVLTCGVPISIQRLHYLDSCELDDEADLHSLDIPDNASFRLGVWNNFEKLMRCIHEKDLEGLLTCGIGNSREEVDTSDGHVSASDAVDDEADLEECGDDEISENPDKPTGNNKRAEVALFVASFVGAQNIIEKLIEMGVNVNCKTTLGYMPLHASVAGGHYKCIDYLLEKGALCDTKSSQAKKAMTIAKVNGFPEGERHLHSFEWQTRAKKVQPSKNTPLMMHQQYDSKTPTWFEGRYSTRYICSTLPRTKFSGTRIDAPLSKSPKTSENRKRYHVIPKIYVPEEGGENPNTKHVSFEEGQGLSFETWLRNKKHQKLVSIQESIEEEKIRQIEKQEKEKNRRTRKMTFFEEQKKRKSRVRDEYSARNRVSMYEDHKYLPNYQSSIIHHYMNELILEHEHSAT